MFIVPSRHVVGMLKITAAGKGNLLIAVFQQVHQLAEDAAQVGAVDPVNNQHTGPSRRRGFGAELQKAAGRHLVAQAAVRLGYRPDALDEIFVGIGG